MAEEFKVEGLKELEEALKVLPVELQAKVYLLLNRKHVKKFIVDNLRSVLNYSQETEKGITTVNDRKDKTGVYGGVTAKSFFLRFADRGTASRTTSRGANRGAVVGKNQIGPTIMEAVPNIINSMNTDLGAETEKILKRLLKTTEKKLTAL